MKKRTAFNDSLMKKFENMKFVFMKMKVMRVILDGNVEEMKICWFRMRKKWLIIEY